MPSSLALRKQNLPFEHPGIAFLSHDTESLIASLLSSFHMEDLGPLKLFLAFDIEKAGDGIMGVCQETFINTIAARFEITSTKAVTSPVAERSCTCTVEWVLASIAAGGVGPARVGPVSMLYQFGIHTILPGTLFLSYVEESVCCLN